MKRRRSLPVIRYEIRAGALHPRSRVIVLEVPLARHARDRMIRKLAWDHELKEIASAFGLGISQVWRITEGYRSGRKAPGGKPGRKKTVGE